MHDNIFQYFLIALKVGMHLSNIVVDVSAKCQSNISVSYPIFQVQDFVWLNYKTSHQILELLQDITCRITAAKVGIIGQIWTHKILFCLPFYSLLQFLLKSVISLAATLCTSPSQSLLFFCSFSNNLFRLTRHQNAVLVAYLMGIHQSPANTSGPLMHKLFPYHEAIMT